jgi:hypothetical protein
VTTLKEECKKYLFRQMPPENCAELLLHSNRLSDEDFMRAAKYFWCNKESVINTEKWKKEKLGSPAFFNDVQQELLFHNKFFFTST